MISTDTLADIGNGQQRRRKVAQTYGRRNGRLPTTQQAEQNIFGQDDSDIENRLSKLKIGPKKSGSSSPVTIKPLFRENANERASRSATSSGPTPKGLDIHQSVDDTQIDEPSLEKLLHLSGSNDIECFADFGYKLVKHFKVEKIGEGSFAEVFKITSTSSATFHNRRENYPVFRAAGSQPLNAPVQQNYTSIIKIIPLASHQTPANVHDRCSSVESVSHEVNILKQLDPVHGFTRFRGLRVVRGQWPESFLQAYSDFRKHHRKRAVNAPPDQDFDSDQLYALVEMDDAGSEISLIKRPSVFQVWDIFWISTILLANAEECIEFEHRDLHLSNICVKGARFSTSPKESEHTTQRSPTSTNRSSQANSDLDIHPRVLTSMTSAPDQKIGLSDLRVTVIDYTVARACLSEEHSEDSPSKPSKSKFLSTRKSVGSVSSDHNANDIMFDPMTFTSDPFTSNQSDIESHLQNLTYKKTRAIAVLNDRIASVPETPCKNAGSKLTQHNKWKAFIPRTNVIWLGYLLRMLIHKARGRNGKLHLLKGTTGKTGNNKLVKEMQEQMWTTLLEASKLLNGHDYKDMEESQEWTQPDGSDSINGNLEVGEPSWTDEELEKLPENSMAVLETAVQTGWLSAEDIQAFRAVLENESS